MPTLKGKDPGTGQWVRVIGGSFFWRGTKAQYDALPSKDPALLYVIEDASGSQWMTEGAADAKYQTPAQADAKYAPIQLSGRNRIMNGDFSVNQRAAGTVITTNTFWCDRWKVWGASTFSATRYASALGDLPESAKFYMRLATSSQAAVSDHAVISHQIEGVGTLSGKTVTLSFYAKAPAGSPKVGISIRQIFGTGGSATVTLSPGNITITGTTWKRYSITLALPSIAGKTIGTDDNLQVLLWSSVGTSFVEVPGLGLQNTNVDIALPQLEEGPIATAYEHKPYTEELRDCMRYYYRINAEGPWQRFGVGLTRVNTGEGLVHFPVTMYKVPTVSASGPETFAIWNGSASTVGTSGPIIGDSASRISANLFLGVPSAAAGQPNVIVQQSTLACWLAFTAEIP